MSEKESNLNLTKHGAFDAAAVRVRRFNKRRILSSACIACFNILRIEIMSHCSLSLDGMRHGGTGRYLERCQCRVGKGEIEHSWQNVNLMIIN